MLWNQAEGLVSLEGDAGIGGWRGYNFVMKVFALQFDVEWLDPRQNLAEVRRLVSQAQPPAGSLVVLPELCAVGFCMDAAATTRAQDETQDALAALAKQWGVFICAGVAAASPNGKPENQAVLFDPAGEMALRYGKRHLFTLAGEHEAYAPGPAVTVAPVGEFTLAPAICYDLRFPEQFRQAVTMGANVMAVLANWPTVRKSHWRALLIARAIENQAYVIGVNRCGEDPNAAYAGGSIVIDPQGEILAEAGDATEILAADLDIKSLHALRAEFPVLDDRRNDELA